MCTLCVVVNYSQNQKNPIVYWVDIFWNSVNNSKWMVLHDWKDCDWPAVDGEKNQPSKTSFSDELNPEFSKNWKNYPTPKVSSKTNP